MRNAARDGSPSMRRTRLVAAALVAAAMLTVAPEAASGAGGTVVRESGVRTLSLTGAEAMAGVELPDRLIVAGTDSVSVDGVPIARGACYALDVETRRVSLLCDFPDTANVAISYLYLPFELEEPYRHAVLESLAALPPWLSGEAQLVPAEPEAAPAVPSGLNVSGAKTFGIKMGTDRDPSLEQSLRLNMSGRITRDVSVNAYLSDQNTPLVPEGDTEELRALDRVLIDIEGENVGATMGDVELDIHGGSLFNVTRELKGATGSARIGRANITLAGASADGEFRSLTFRGVDGKQGPYLLTGGGGEAGVSVVAGSERVWLDGVLMKRGTDNDYVIDYVSGEIEFTENRHLSSDNEVTVDYEYSLSDFERDIYGGRGQVELSEGASVGISFFREVDDEGSPISTVLTDEQIAVLENAGDDPSLAHDAGVDSVGVGGDYDLVSEGVFEYAGADSGVYDLHFEPEVGGAYDYDFEGDRYVYVGEGEGDYRLGRRLPVPTDRGLAAVDAQFELPADGSVDLETAVSAFDRNTFSDIGDKDNLGNAQVLSATLPRLRFGASGDGTVGLSLAARRVGGNFEGVGRYRDVRYVEKWELEGLDLPAQELMLEGGGTVELSGRGRLSASYSYLERGDAVNSRKTEFSLDARPGIGFRVNADGRLVDLESYDGNRDRALLRGSVEKEIGSFTPGVSYRHDSRSVPGETGERYDEYAGSLSGKDGRGSRFSARYAYRATERMDGEGWSRASTTRTQEYALTLRRSELLSVEAAATRRTTEFEPGLEEPGTRYDLASIRATHRSMDGALQGELRYAVTSTEVEEKKKVVILKDGVETTRVMSTGRFYPVTDLTAGTGWKLRFRPRGGRAMPDPSSLRRFLSTVSLETDLKLSEVTTTSERWRLYALDPAVIRGEDTVKGELSGRHVARYTAADGTRSLRLAFTTRDVLDRSYENATERREERTGTVDLKLSPSGGVTYRIEGDLSRREQHSEGTGYSYEIDERTGLLELTSRRLGDLEIKVTASATGTDERMDAISIFQMTVTPALTYRLRGKGTITASLSRIDLSSDVDSFPVYLVGARRPGVTSEWRIFGDYRLNRFLTASLSYLGERRPGSDTRHTVDARMNAYF